MFTSLTVPLDGSPAGQRALAIAGDLARRSRLPVEVVTVVGSEEDCRLEAAVTRQVAELDDPIPELTLVHAGWPGDAVVQFLQQRPDSLVVMATHARGPVTEALFGSVSEHVLSHVHNPVLLVGPRVADSHPGMRTLIAMVDGTEAAEAVLSPVVDWTTAFGGEKPWLVEVLDEDVAVADVFESVYVARVADRLRTEGLDIAYDVAHGSDPARRTIDFARGFTAPVLAIASGRWTDPRTVRMRSTARALTHRSPYPVLVVHTVPVPAHAHR